MIMGSDRVFTYNLIIIIIHLQKYNHLGPDLYSVFFDF